MKQLILVRGLSGSGKTTLADTICGEIEDRFKVSADEFFVDDSGVYSFNHEALKEAQNEMQSKYPDQPYMWAGFVLIH